MGRSALAFIPFRRHRRGFRPRLGRGSDESAEYGLRLFKQLQKIHIIEPFVASVGFVHNEDGSASKLRNLAIEDYRAERDALT